jgi:hypothetical protein
VPVINRVLVHLVIEDSHVRSSAAPLVVKQPAQIRERVPGGRQRFADGARLDREVAAAARV